MIDEHKRIPNHSIVKGVELMSKSVTCAIAAVILFGQKSLRLRLKNEVQDCNKCKSST